VIHDWKKFGMLSVRGILANSSDVGAIKLALRVGNQKFYETASAFGIGQLTGIELPGENRGLLRPVSNWSANSIGSLAMGQEVMSPGADHLGDFGHSKRRHPLPPARDARNSGRR